MGKEVHFVSRFKKYLLNVKGTLCLKNSSNFTVISGDNGFVE